MCSLWWLIFVWLAQHHGDGAVKATSFLARQFCVIEAFMRSLAENVSYGITVFLLT
jgi:hypothetical protein